MKKIFSAIAALIILFTIFALYGQHVVYRYPRLTADPVPRAESLKLNNGLEIDVDGGYLKDVSEPRFRAYQPDVNIRISSTGQTDEQRIRFENIHPDAVFMVTGQNSARVSESQAGLMREVKISAMPAGENLLLSWKFPEKPGYKFVAIGDTGGDRELSWGLIRAYDLGADFMLHLGDAYYLEAEISGIGARMNASKIPVYTSNGNHDFRGPNGNAIDQFLNDIGPLNARFSLLGNCFINLDTGAFMYPPHKGERAAMLAAEVINQNRDASGCANTIVFTHKPLLTKFEAEFPKRKHTLHGRDSRRIIDRLQQLDNVTILAGHIHDDFEFEQDGFKTYVTGNGLAHKDLLQGGHYARVLVGEIRVDQPVKLEWALNAMPMEYHCSKKIYNKLKQHKSPMAKAVHDACKGKP